MTDVEILNAAAGLIERNGLYKHDLWPKCEKGRPYRPGMPVCARGALAVVMDTGVSETVEVSKLLAASLGYAEIKDVVHWNDDPATTAELVAKTMRACAESL